MTARRPGSFTRHLQPQGLHDTGNSYSHVVEVRGGGVRTVYVSGQVALDANGTLVGTGDIRAQTRQAFVNIGVALDAVGAGFGDIVRLGYFLTDISTIPALREVRDEFIDESDRPASTAVEVSRLFEEGLLVEIEAVAVVIETG